MSFSMETEKENKLSFLDVKVIREKGKLTTTIYQKPTISGVYSNFESFLPSVYKFGMVYTLVYRYFRICSNWTQFHTKLSDTAKNDVVKKNVYDKLVSKVDNIDTRGFALKTKYDTDKSKLENTIPDTSVLVKKNRLLC